MTSVIVRGDIELGMLDMVRKSGRVAWDIETTGLSYASETIATCQLAIHDLAPLLIQIDPHTIPHNLIALLSDETVLKVFHHAPFDLAFMRYQWSAVAKQVACTKVASKLLRNILPNSVHSLQSLLHSELGIEIDKSERRSDWARRSLTPTQVEYAVNDVRYLLELFDTLREKLGLQDKAELYEKCCAFLPTYVELKVSNKEAIFDY